MSDNVQETAGAERSAALAEIAAQAALSTQALIAVQLFGGEFLDRYEASELLDLWRHRADLEQAAVNQVLAHFPCPKDSTS